MQAVEGKGRGVVHLSQRERATAHTRNPAWQRKSSRAGQSRPGKSSAHSHLRGQTHTRSSCTFLAKPINLSLTQQPAGNTPQQPSRQRRTMEDPAARTMEDPARRRPLAEDTKAPCGAITPGAEGLPSSVPDAHLPNARLPPCGGPSPPCACPRGLTPRATTPCPDPRSDGRGGAPQQRDCGGR